MEKKESRPTRERKWRAETDKLRLNSFQKFRAVHEKDSSPRSPHTPWTPRTSRSPSTLSKKQKNIPDLLSQSPEPDHNIDKTRDREDQVVTEKIQRHDESKTPSKTPRSSFSNECDGLDSQTLSSGSGPTVVDASTIHDLAEWQFNSETRRVDEAPDSPHSPGSDRVKSPHSPPGDDQVKSPRPESNSPKSGQIVNLDSQSNSPGGDHTSIPHPQPHFPGGDHTSIPHPQPHSPGGDHTSIPHPQPHFPGADHIKSPTPQPQSPESGGVTVETSPTQDQVEEEFDAEAWLNSDSPLPGNYKAIFPKSPGSMSSDSSSPPTSGTDSLIVSPARLDEQQGSEEEEENPGASMANADIMKLFAEYEASSQLRLSFEEYEAKDERGARAAIDRKNESFRDRDSDLSSVSSTDSDGSILMSHGQDHGESPIKSENSHDDLKRAKEAEETNQVALQLFELYGAKFELQKILEEKEAKFERDIRVAWTAPRPPPTTREQRLDRIALEKIESKEIFDEFGEQQRPVRTDPEMVSYETEIGIMINRARIKYMLEDYPNMYNHANHAAAAAAKLQFPPLTARCCYYRGMASYHYGDLANAKDDFLASRGCAGLFGISSKSIEEYIDRIDLAEGPDLTIIEPFPAREAERTTTTGSKDGNEPSPSTTDDATTLVGGSPTSPESTAAALSPSISPGEEERCAGNSPEDANSQTQPFRKADPLSGFPLGGDPQCGTEQIPNYQPQEAAISEQIRKDIFESKAQSLNNVSEASPVRTNPLERTTLSPASMASTERTLLGSATSQGTTRRVPRPYVAPITTSLAKSSPVRPVPMTAAIGGARDEATPVPDSADEINEDEIMHAFGADRSGCIGAQGDDFTPSETERGIWTRNT